MNSKYIWHLLIALISLVALILIQYNQPQKINWFPSYVSTHKIPYGTLVFNNLLRDMYPGQTKQIYIPPYDVVKQNDTLKGTYVFINDEVQFEKAELDALLNWTSSGNTLFIASKTLEKQLLDTLHLKTSTKYDGLGTIQMQHLQLVNPYLKTKDTNIFDKNSSFPYFSRLDTLKTTVLGTIGTAEKNRQLDTTSYVNFIKQPFGKGQIMLSTFPEGFTNYFILQGTNKDYVSGISSYLAKAETIYLDNNHKTGKTFHTSPMYLFLNNKELKWAYYMVLIGLFFYLVFEGKRKQRAIPVIPPLKNQTLAFTRTISDMYFEKKDQKSIALYTIDYFLEDLKNSFYFPANLSKDTYYRMLSAKSGQSAQWVEGFFKFIEKLKNSSEITDNELILLNSNIKKFKSSIHGK